MTKPEYHSIKTTIDAYGIHWGFECSAPVGARCRLICEQGCESWSFGTEKLSPEESYHGGHTYADDGNCKLVEFIELDEAEIYEKAGFVEDDASWVIHPGPVKLLWNGDFVEWSYIEESSDAAT